MDVIANNIANMNTTAYKGERMMFVEHLVLSRGGERPQGERVAYVRDVATFRDLSEGGLEPTGNPLDLAISGEGYFVVQTPAGDRYTRNGRFQLDGGGQIVTQTGFPLLAENGQALAIPPGAEKIDITPDGVVVTESGQAGRVRVVRFDNQQRLDQLADGLYATADQPQDVERPKVAQGMLERSNVEPILEIARMIEVQRAYEGVRNFIEKEDERMRTLVREMIRV
jgi:flagellar basal-body rod protein FlgF